MVARIATITIKSPDPAELARFWRELLGYEEVEHPTTSIKLDDPGGSGPTLLIQPSDAVHVGGPIHLDLRPDDQVTVVADALRLGARKVDIGQDGTETWVVLADPDGHAFCVLQSDSDLAARNQTSPRD
jgi:catechol 2,3-dioxygenase-like lactoylglutathione lyase family enzyme